MPCGLEAVDARTGCLERMYESVGQRATARRFERRAPRSSRRSATRLGAGLEADVDGGRERLAVAAWAGGSGSSIAVTVAPRWRKRVRHRRVSALSPPNWPTTTRRSPRRGASPTAPRAHGASRRRGRPLWRPSRSSARTVSARTRRRRSRPQLRWKSARRGPSSGPRMPSTRPQSKPSRPSARCSSATSSPRRFGRDRARAGGRRAARRLDQRRPRRLVAAPVDAQAAALLERRDGALRRRRQNTPASAPAGGNPARAEAALQVADRRRRADRGSAGSKRGIRRAPGAAGPCPWRRRAACATSPPVEHEQGRDAHHVEAHRQRRGCRRR